MAKLLVDKKDSIGDSARYTGTSAGNTFKPEIGRKIYISPKAIAFVERLNGYDFSRVKAEIEALSAIPSPLNGLVNKFRPSFFKAKDVASNQLHFILKYEITSSSVIISSILLNQERFGAKQKSRDERTCLYHVDKTDPNNHFDSTSSATSVLRLPDAWRRGEAVTEVKTVHAAVNGMLNDLNKATWLMGVHSEHAYSDDELSEYTLLHNPSENAALDFYECVKGNLGITTENGKYLAAVLADIQSKGTHVKWTVHSQGGIIFKEALSHFSRLHPGRSLNKNSVVIHSGGQNKKEINRLLQKVGIKKEKPDNDNPFDIVPNVAGFNNMNKRAISRSVKFFGKVKGNKTSGPEESPHTLPFISLEAYHRFLTLAGDTQKAKAVETYMQDLLPK
jgi:hypothetical protein